MDVCLSYKFWILRSVFFLLQLITAYWMQTLIFQLLEPILNATEVNTVCGTRSQLNWTLTLKININHWEMERETRNQGLGKSCSADVLLNVILPVGFRKTCNSFCKSRAEHLVNVNWSSPPQRALSLQRQKIWSLFFYLSSTYQQVFFGLFFKT